MLQAIKRDLPNHPWADKIQYFDSIGSTNTYAKELAVAGAPAGTVVIAGQQTAGRGRMGRSFASAGNMGIYLSVILRPDCYPADMMHLTCAAGVAACQAIGDPNVGIKWTNDLVLEKRKLGGILTELSINHFTQKVAWVVVGVGINCCQKITDFPKELQSMACSLGLDQKEIPALTAKLIHALHKMDQTLLTGQAQIMQTFRSKCITIDSVISVVRGDDVRHGRAVWVNDDGGLVVEYPGGSADVVTSGEVSIRGMYGYV